MVAEPLSQIGSEAVIDGTAVRVIGVHVTERHATGVVERGRRRIALSVESWESREESLCLPNTRELIGIAA